MKIAALVWRPCFTPAAEALRIATALAYPVMPDATAKIWTQLGLGDIKKLALDELAWGQLPLGTKLGEVQPVFPRADKSAIERMQKMEEEQQSTPAADAAGATAPASCKRTRRKRTRLRRRRRAAATPFLQRRKDFDR